MSGAILIFASVIVVFIYLLFVGWGAILKIREWRRIQKIKKQLTAPFIDEQVKNEKEYTRDLLFGFLFSDIVLFGSNFVLAIAVLSSSWLAWETVKMNRNANLEFQLRTRPYLIIDNVEGNTDLTTTKSDFRIFIKNSGNMPAKIISQVMYCSDNSTNQSFVPKNDIIGINQSIVYPFSSSGIKEFSCTLDIKYHSAIENFSKDEYETQQKFLYKFGEQMGSGGGLMR